MTNDGLLSYSEDEDDVIEKAYEATKAEEQSAYKHKNRERVFDLPPINSDYRSQNLHHYYDEQEPPNDNRAVEYYYDVKGDVMGSGCKMRCPQCGYEFYKSEGVGFMFPMVYQELVQKSKNGELGGEIKSFFSEHPDGAINADRTTLVCDDCGCLASDYNLTMYIPDNIKREKANGLRWSVSMPFSGADYVMSEDLGRFYKEYMKYPHKCKNCGGSMHISGHKEKLMCPECKIPLEIDGFICWD